MTGVLEESPYVGLRPFAATDASRFSGRTAAVHSLLADWLDHRLVILHGTRGAGKSSLLLGGVVPLVQAAEADLLSVLCFPAAAGATPDQAEPVDVNPFISTLLSSWFPGIRPDGEIAGSSLVDLARRHPRWQEYFAARRPVLAALDQFEWALAATSPELRAQRDTFIQSLGELVAALPNLHLLVSVRDDDRARLAPHERTLAAGVDVARVRVGPLARDAAATALREPLRATGFALSVDAATAMVDDLCTSVVRDSGGARSARVTDSVEPAFVQIIGAALWESLRGGPDADPGAGASLPATPVRRDLVTRAGGDVTLLRVLPGLPGRSGVPDQARSGIDDPPVVVSAGQVEGLVGLALGRHVTRALLELAERYGRTDTELRDWLVRTFVTERGRRGFADEGIRDTNGMPNELVHGLAERYILTSEWRADSRWFALIHDRLLDVLQTYGAPRGLLAGPGPASAAELLGAARAQLRDGDADLAAAHAEEAVRRTEGRSRVRADAELVWGESLQRSGHPDDAELHYREAAAVYESLPDSRNAGRVLTIIGRLLLDRGLHGRAVEELEAAVTRLPGDAEVQADLARALWYSGQPWAAAAVFSTVLMIAPRSPHALADRGQLRLELGDDTSALADLDGSARLAPEIGSTPEVRAARGLALARLGHLTEGSTETDAALEIAPDNGTVLLWAAGVARAAGDGDGADAMLRRSLRARQPALLPHQVIEAMRQLRKPGAMA